MSGQDEIPNQEEQDFRAKLAATVRRGSVADDVAAVRRALSGLNVQVDNGKAHYQRDTGHEAIDVIEAWGLGFSLGNAVKYICRAGLKVNTTRLDDLRKALWYVQREIRNEERRNSEVDMTKNTHAPGGK